MKKILCFLLCMMLVIPTVGSLADEYTIIEQMAVTVNAPSDGTVISSAGDAASRIRITTESPHFSVKSARWQDEDKNPISLPFTAQAGEDYYLYCEFSADEGYAFDRFVLKVSGQGVEKNGASMDDCVEGGKAKNYKQTFKVSVTGSISRVSIIVTLPKAGTTAAEKPHIETSQGSHCMAGVVGWVTDDYSTELDETTVFEEGKAYYIKAMLISDQAYKFESPEILLTNGTLMQNYASPFPSAVRDRMFDFVVKIVIPKEGADPIPAEPAEPAASAGSTEPTEPTEQVTFKKLKSVKLTAVSAKKLKVEWKKLSSKDKKKIKKIQIQVSTDKNFTTIVKEKFLKSSKSSWTIPGLKKNTKYYVRIRAYTKDGNVINVSKWVTKNKKTKKK